VIAGFVALALVLGAMLASELGNYGSHDDDNKTSANEPTGSAPSAAQPVAPPNSPGAAPGKSVSDQVAAVLNQELDGLGCAPVTVDARLVANAQSHTVQMLRSGYYDDVSQGGTGPQARAKAAGYDAKVIESIVLGADTVAQATKLAFPTPVSSNDATPTTVEVIAKNTLSCGWAHVGAQAAKDSRRVPVWSIVLGR
jgi:uncharacterized protein YkwD